MKKAGTWLAVLAGGMAVGAAVAVYDLVTGWTIPGGFAAAAVVLGLFLGSLAALTAAVVIAFVDRSRIKGLAEDPPTKAARLAGRARWSSLFAACFAVLVFADCSGAVGNNGHEVVGAMSDPTRYWSMAAGLLLPTVILLALPGVLATIAERLTRRRWAIAAIFVSGAAAAVAFVTAPVAVVFGVSACDFGTSAGMCAAGIGGVANGFTIGALALFLPYLTLLPAYLPREAGAPPK